MAKDKPVDYNEYVYYESNVTQRLRGTAVAVVKLDRLLVSVALQKETDCYRRKTGLRWARRYYRLYAVSPLGFCDCGHHEKVTNPIHAFPINPGESKEDSLRYVRECCQQAIEDVRECVLRARAVRFAEKYMCKIRKEAERTGTDRFLTYRIDVAG